MRNDGDARIAEALIGAGLFRMPVGVEQVRTGPLLSAATAWAKAAAFALSPPSTSTTPSAEVFATTLPPAPLRIKTFSSSLVVVIFAGALCANADRTSTVCPAAPAAAA